MTVSRSLHCLTLALLLAQSAIAVQTVRVDATSAAPRLLVDGQPVRARMFWGAPGTRPIPAATAGQAVRFEFQPTTDEPSHATMHFRFGPSAGDIYLDDIRVVDLDTHRDVLPRCDFEKGEASFRREWMVWPAAKPQNTVGTVSVEKGVGRDGSAGLHIHLQNPPSGVWPDFHIHHQANLARRLHSSAHRRSLNSARHRSNRNTGQKHQKYQSDGPAQTPAPQKFPLIPRRFGFAHEIMLLLLSVLVEGTERHSRIGRCARCAVA